MPQHNLSVLSFFVFMFLQALLWPYKFIAPDVVHLMQQPFVKVTSNAWRYLNTQIYKCFKELLFQSTVKHHLLFSNLYYSNNWLKYSHLSLLLQTSILFNFVGSLPCLVWLFVQCLFNLLYYLFGGCTCLQHQFCVQF